MAFDTQEILQAIEIIAKSQVNGLNLDKTITAQISNIINLDTGEYKVNYEGNTFSAFSANPTITYEEEDSVYVKIPQNDMSQRKIIEGIAHGEKTLTNIIEQQTAVNLIGPAWEKFYGYHAMDEFGICAGVDEDHRNFFRYIYQAPIDAIGDAFFQNYSSKYKQIRFSASFLTRFLGQHSRGNYGLIVTFRVNTADDNGISKVSYRLDINNFVGSPYGYTTWSPQSIIIDVQNNYLLGLDSILLFQEDFDLDTTYNFDGQIISQNDGNTDNFNILVKDIELSFVELIDLTKDIYYLDIATTEGISFMNSTDILPLTGKLKYQGKDIMSEKTCNCYWYKENPQIMIGHEKYDKLAGPGWELIKTADFNQLEVSAEDVPYHADYKLIVIYNKVTLTKEITLYNYNSLYNFSLVQETNGSDISLRIQNNKNNDPLFGDWYFYLPDGSYNLIASNQKQIKINDYLLYTFVIFYCLVRDGSKPVAVEHITIQNSSQISDVTIAYDGQDLYQYDVNGDLAFEDTEVDRTLAAKITWKEGFGSAYNITWIAPDGHELPYNRIKPYTPDSSMMQNLWVDNYNILHYNIRQKYTLNYSNNTITIVITTADKHKYKFEKEVLFLKDGDQGTNGSTYRCVIRPVDILTGLKETSLKALSYNNGWGKGLDLRCFVYRNGDLINEASDVYDITYDWTCGSQNKSALSIDPITGLINKPDYVVVNGQGELNTVGDYVIKVALKIKAKGSAIMDRWDDNTELYCQYPLDIAVNGIDPESLEVELPSFVKYSAAGINPLYQTSELICDMGEISAILTSTNRNLFDIRTNLYGQKVLDPVDKFLYREGIAAIKCAFDDQYLLHPVMMYLNTYGNETINGWDGTKLEINEDKGYVLAPQVGAGKKNGDGTFTGVLMGRQSGPAADNDIFGLFGYLKGISTFGLKEDGTAYIGAVGDGQIIFDGTKNGIIKSGNYDGEIYDSDGNLIIDASGERGMKIELTTGHIDAYNFRISSGNMTLDSGKQQFLFNIGDQNSSYFRICTIGDGADTEKKTLFNVSSSNYYLQTEDFAREANGVTGKGTKIDLKAGSITSYNFAIKTPYMELNSNSDKGRFVFDVRGGGRFEIKGVKEDQSEVSLFCVTGTTYYLQSTNYNGGKGSNLQGVYMNLRNGQFKVGGQAEFNGSIYAKQGEIGGWNISKNAIAKGQTILSSVSGISTSQINIYDTFYTPEGDPSHTGYLGTFGYVEGKDEEGITNNVGIKTTTQSIILSSGKNIALKSDNGVWITGRSLSCGIPAENQKGIYARFA